MLSSCQAAIPCAMHLRLLNLSPCLPFRYLVYKHVTLCWSISMGPYKTSRQVVVAEHTRREQWESQLASHSGFPEAGSCIFALGAELFLNAEKLIVLGKTLTAARCTGLD